MRLIQLPALGGSAVLGGAGLVIVVDGRAGAFVGMGFFAAVGFLRGGERVVGLLVGGMGLDFGLDILMADSQEDF